MKNKKECIDRERLRMMRANGTRSLTLYYQQHKGTVGQGREPAL